MWIPGMGEKEGEVYLSSWIQSISVRMREKRKKGRFWRESDGCVFFSSSPLALFLSLSLFLSPFLFARILHT